MLAETIIGGRTVPSYIVRTAIAYWKIATAPAEWEVRDPHTGRVVTRVRLVPEHELAA